jgi:uncharacterized damage-inducible protein DinB
MQTPGLSFEDLLAYTDWQRRHWFEWMRQQDRAVLQVSTGPGGDGRFQRIGDVVRHIFSAERRYVDRLSNRPITDTATIPTDNLELLFQFGEQSRHEFSAFLTALPAESWDAPIEMQLMNNSLAASPKKIVAHVFFHEIRHWAQIATLLRLNGFKPEFHDFLFCPVMGGEFRLSPPNA